MFFGKKDKNQPPKKKTLDQMSGDEIKAFQNDMKKEIRGAVREIDRQIFQADRMVMEAKRDLEKKIKEGKDRNTLKIYAQNLMKAQTAKDKHVTQKTKVQSVEFNINTTIMSAKMSKTMGQASEMMGLVNSLANIPEITKNVQNMQMQMEKMGIVGEMVEDAMDALDDDVDIDDKAQDLLDDMEAKLNPKTKTKNTQQAESLDDQIKNLAL